MNNFFRAIRYMDQTGGVLTGRQFKRMRQKSKLGRLFHPSIEGTRDAWRRAKVAKS